MKTNKFQRLILGVLTLTLMLANILISSPKTASAEPPAITREEYSDAVKKVLAPEPGVPPTMEDRRKLAELSRSLLNNAPTTGQLSMPYPVMYTVTFSLHDTGNQLWSVVTYRARIQNNQQLIVKHTAIDFKAIDWISLNGATADHFDNLLIDMYRERDQLPSAIANRTPERSRAIDLAPFIRNGNAKGAIEALAAAQDQFLEDNVKNPLEQFFNKRGIVVNNLPAERPSINDDDSTTFSCRNFVPSCKAAGESLIGKGGSIGETIAYGWWGDIWDGIKKKAICAGFYSGGIGSVISIIISAGDAASVIQHVIDGNYCEAIIETILMVVDCIPGVGLTTNIISTVVGTVSGEACDAVFPDDPPCEGYPYGGSGDCE